MNEEIYWIWLQHALGVGAPEGAAILDEFENAKAVFDATSYPVALELTPTQRRRLSKKDLSESAAVFKRTTEKGAWVMTPEDPVYRTLFEGMYAPPMVLYGKGKRFDPSGSLTVAVVGTRHHDDAGLLATRSIAAGLAAGGAVLVSGGAVGLDSAALDAAIDAGGRCLSFQACGIDRDYPAATADTRRRLLENGGMLLTEFPVGCPPYRGNFRVRNRLIAAAARGTLVTQAPKGSGALITARWAMEQGRDVYAMPGAVGRACCEGSNELIKEGATLVTNAADILMNYIEQYPFAVDIDAAATAERDALRRKPTRSADRKDDLSLPQEQAALKVAQPPKEAERVPCPDTASPQQQQLYAALLNGPQNVTELARSLSLPPSTVLSLLSVMELRGVVTCTAGQCYSISLK